MKSRFFFFICKRNYAIIASVDHHHLSITAHKTHLRYQLYTVDKKKKKLSKRSSACKFKMFFNNGQHRPIHYSSTFGLIALGELFVGPVTQVLFEAFVRMVAQTAF